MGIRRTIDIIRNAQYQPDFKNNLETFDHGSLFLKEKIMTEPESKQISFEDWSEWVIEAASARHIAAGKTKEEARKIILAAFASKEVNCPAIDDL